jgi:hypothetical protein
MHIIVSILQIYLRVCPSQLHRILRLDVASSSRPFLYVRAIVFRSGGRLPPRTRTGAKPPTPSLVIWSATRGLGRCSRASRSKAGSRSSLRAELMSYAAVDRSLCLSRLRTKARNPGDTWTRSDALFATVPYVMSHAVDWHARHAGFSQEAPKDYFLRRFFTFWPSLLVYRMNGHVSANVHQMRKVLARCSA